MQPGEAGSIVTMEKKMETTIVFYGDYTVTMGNKMETTIAPLKYIECGVCWNLIARLVNSMLHLPKGTTDTGSMFAQQQLQQFHKRGF